MCYCSNMGWNGYWNKSQHRKPTLDEVFLLQILLGFKPTTFQSQVQHFNHRAIPAPLCVDLIYGIWKRSEILPCNTWKPVKWLNWRDYYYIAFLPDSRSTAMARMCDYGLRVVTTSTWSWRGAASWTTVMKSKWQLGKNTNLTTTVWVEFCCCLSVVVFHQFSSFAISSWDDSVADRTHLQCFLVIAGGGGVRVGTGKTLVSFISHFCLIVNYVLFQEVWWQDIVCLFALLLI